MKTTYQINKERETLPFESGWCDGGKCEAGKRGDETVIRMFQMSAGPHHGNLHLCPICWKHEMEYHRREEENNG